MDKAILFFSVALLLFGSANAQQRNSFSIGLGSISTQNNEAQPATSLTGQFETLLVDSKKEMKVYIGVDFSTYLNEGLRLSSCSDCQKDEYSGFDLGVRLSFELQETAIPIQVFSGFSRIVTKRNLTRGDLTSETIYLGPEYVGSMNIISNFWDIGFGLTAPIAQKFFFSAEALTGYSLESDPAAQQGFERFEMNLGIGFKF